MHDFFTQEDNVHLQQGAEKPKIGNADDRQPQCSVPVQSLQANSDLSPWIELKRFLSAGCGDTLNAQAGQKPGDGDENEDHADQAKVVLPGGKHQASDRCPQENGKKRTHFQKTVGPRKILVRKDFRKQAIFCRAEEGRL